MSESDNLAEAFGTPARSLSSRLPPRRRRDSRPEDSTPKGSEDGAETRHGQTGLGSRDSATSGGAGTSSPALPPADDGPPQGALTVVPTPRPTAADPFAAEPAPSGSGSTQARGSSRRSSSGKASGPATSTNADDHVSFQTVVYVHPKVKAIATAQRREQKMSNAEIAFDAIDAVQHRLSGLIRTRRLQSRPESSLFPGRVRRGRLSGGGAAAAAGEARRVLWGFRATSQELAVIDRLVERSGAESRSELVATALEEVLLQRP